MSIFEGYVVATRRRFEKDGDEYCYNTHKWVTVPAGQWTEWSYQTGRSASVNPMIYTTPKKGLKGRQEG